MRKSFITLGLLILVLLFNGISVYAISEKLTYAESIAPELKELGMFVGTDKGFELERPANRAEALTMLVRLLGKETEAKNGTWEHPFNDVPTWADEIVGFAYTNGLTSGVSASKFGSYDTVSSVQYITFVLRALKYSDSKEVEDFTWDNPFDLATEIGLIGNGEYNKDSEFLRADVAIVSYNALSLIPKNGQNTLKDTLSFASQEQEEPKKPEEKPEEPKKPEPKPEEPKKPVEPEEPKKPEEPKDDFENTGGKGDTREAGVFRTKSSNLVTVNKSADYDTNLGNLNNMIFKTFGLRYQPYISQTGTSWGKTKFLHDEDTNRYGLLVGEWRKSYDSGLAVNTYLNAVLETFYFFTGDKEVSYALWSWIDANSINGYTSTDDFGFSTVKETKNGGIVTMNGVEIEIIFGGGTTLYFK